MEGARPEDGMRRRRNEEVRRPCLRGLGVGGGALGRERRLRCAGSGRKEGSAKKARPKRR